jgi:tetratricopeptide (TPR) repeat protein
MSNALRRAILAAILILGAPCASGAAEKITDAAVTRLEQWVKAVTDHTPGQVDAAVGMVRTWTFAQRTELNPAMQMFLDALTRPQAPIPQPKTGKPARPDERVRSFAAATLQSAGLTTFLERAAVLHGDAAMAAPFPSAASTAGARPDNRAPRPGSKPDPPLLYRARALIDTDGEIRDEMPRDWNWPFARSVLEPQMFKRAEATWPMPFVAQWYHATAAFMLRNGLYSDARMHLQNAATVLADDPFVLFDRACLAEIHGLPIVQNVLTERDMVTLRRREARREEYGGEMANVLGVPLLEMTNAEAERLFRRTLSVAPSFAEARVRLARLLLVRGRSGEALEEARATLKANPEPTVRFYADLMASRASRMLGQFEAAAGYVSEAVGLFPNAQSALVAASHLSMTRSDLEAALASLGRLSILDEGAPFDRDPWWSYRWGAGRDVDALLTTLWASVQQRR